MTGKVNEGFVTGQVTVLLVALQIVPANSGRDVVKLINTTAVACWLGNANVTVGNGFLLPGVIGATVEVPSTAAVFGITASSATVAFMDCA